MKKKLTRTHVKAPITRVRPGKRTDQKKSWKLPSVKVPDLGCKIDLLLHQTGLTDLALREQLDMSSDYYSRLKNGSRTATPEIFENLKKILDPKSQIDFWNDELEAFGRRLGLSRREVGYICNRPVPGIDFTPRIKDPEHVQRILKVLHGFWEITYFSASDTNLAVERKLLNISKMNDDGFIECVAFGVPEGQEHYRGWCYPTNYHLYAILEDVRLFSEIIFGVLNLPDRTPPVLRGVFLGVSGGIDPAALGFIPCAARVIWRHLGNEMKLAAELGCKADEVEERLKKKIPLHCNPAELTNPDDLKILGQISNFVPLNSRPFALRMDGERRDYEEPKPAGQQVRNIEAVPNLPVKNLNR